MSEQNPPPRPGNYERSWNDPPLFSYGSSNQSSENARKPGGTRLNQRVGFPSSSANSNTVPDAYISENKEMPPCPQMYSQSTSITDCLRPPPINTSIQQSPNSNDSTKPLQMLPYDYKNTSNPNKSHVNCDDNVDQMDESDPCVEDVAHDFDKVLDKISSDIDKKKIADVKKRLDMMTSKWKNNAFNPQIHKGMGRMAKCLMAALRCEENSSELSDETKVDIQSAINEAENIQKKLMVDWPSMCGTWMVGIKHLIQEIRRILLVKGELNDSREETGINVPL